MTDPDQELAERVLKDRCPLCLNPLADTQPREGTSNGMHHYCLLLNTAGHLVEVCGCHPETVGALSVREQAILAEYRFHARYGD